MKESYEIDNLRRKVEDARMKITTEIKVTNFLIHHLKQVQSTETG